MLVKPEHPLKHLLPKAVTEEGIVTLCKLEQPEKHELPKVVTEGGMVILVKLRHSLNAFSVNVTTGYSAPSVAFTFSGTTTFPEYFWSPLSGMTVAVFASESIR